MKFRKEIVRQILHKRNVSGLAGFSITRDLSCVAFASAAQNEETIQNVRGELECCVPRLVLSARRQCEGRVRFASFSPPSLRCYIYSSNGNKPVNLHNNTYCISVRFTNRAARLATFERYEARNVLLGERRVEISRALDSNSALESRLKEE